MEERRGCGMGQSMIPFCFVFSSMEELAVEGSLYYGTDMEVHD